MPTVNELKQNLINTINTFSTKYNVVVGPDIRIDCHTMPDAAQWVWCAEFSINKVNVSPYANTLQELHDTIANSSEELIKEIKEKGVQVISNRWSPGFEDGSSEIYIIVKFINQMYDYSIEDIETVCYFDADPDEIETLYDMEDNNVLNDIITNFENKTNKYADLHAFTSYFETSIKEMIVEGFNYDPEEDANNDDNFDDELDDDDEDVADDF